MLNLNDEMELEQKHLDYTVKFIEDQVKILEKGFDKKLSKFRDSGKEMWENSAHFSNDVDKIPDINNQLFEVGTASRNFKASERDLEKYKKSMEAPYFGRFDFVEENYEEQEKIYLGRFNIMDNKTNEIYVYDWRSPVASMFYRHELGMATYKSPIGNINGEILLKRQYKIEKSKLKYYFDSSTSINDDILQEALGNNSSNKMKNIVETIQKEQDIIIRDIENELLIVQGVAGSGKTSIALHRIAFLLYAYLGKKLEANNIIIISPNSIFSNYISEVLPELGEENVREITYDEIIKNTFGHKFKIQNRKEALEEIIQKQNSDESKIRVDNMSFKGSIEFVAILDRFVKYYEHNLIQFNDISYDGIIVEKRQELKNEFLNNKINMPIARRLKRMENRILYKIHPMRKQRIYKIEQIVRQYPWHQFEAKSFSRLLSIKKSKSTLKTIKSFSNINYLEIYKCLFAKKELFYKLSSGMNLPENMEKILSETYNRLKDGYVAFEDSAPLLYLKLIIGGNEDYEQIRQIVIDEAQDYYPIQYKIFGILFKNARYTVLGDYNQIVEKTKSKNIYDEIITTLNKKKSVKLSLKNGYRSSYEINLFSQKLLQNNEGVDSFIRHEEEPLVWYRNNFHEINEGVADYTQKCYEQGFESIGIICKTEEQKEQVYNDLNKLMKVNVLNEDSREINKGAVVLSTYMSKGLEFDVVIIYDVSNKNYHSDLDRRLLYIACTRALHRLAIYHTGEKSSLI
jgi:DNA helicase-2/ATP-dependent DNA helicase PcrA